MQRIGKYHVQRVLGHGGMGTVYEALDPVINRKLAVKTMIPGLAEAPDLRARFKREAQAAGGLHHRNIVTVYDLGEDNGQPFIAMEFIEGSDLEKIIQQKQPLSVEWKLDVIRQICEGLAYAHRSGIVHRDIKPANIRVTPEGEVKIMDFGIAHLQSSTMTKSGLVLGTAHYMAPEQIEGRKVDHRADVFSVGAIAYELLAHRRPFDGESLTAIMFKIMREEADPAALPTTEYSPGLEKIILKALARDAAERYQALDEMRDDLERLVRRTAPRVQQHSAPMATGPVATELRAELERARHEGQLQKALGLCRRLLETDPRDEAAARAAAEVEAAIQDREVAQLCSLALAYATDGDLGLARTIAGKVEGFAASSARLAELRVYIEAETSRKEADARTALAQEHVAQGNLAAAHRAATEALQLCATHTLAREILDSTGRVLAVHGSGVAGGTAVEAAYPAPHSPTEAAAPSATAVALDAAPPRADALTPVPQGPPVDAEAAALLEAARRLLRDRSPQRALVPLEQAAVLAPDHAGVERLLARTRLDARKAEVEALTTAGVDHFVQSDHARARRAVEKALALDPDNRKARELLKILSSLG